MPVILSEAQRNEESLCIKEILHLRRRMTRLREILHLRLRMSIEVILNEAQRSEGSL